MNKSLSTDKRLLEAIDLIDDKYIDEVADGYEVLRIPGEYTPNKKKVYKAYLKFALRAACAMLIVGLLISAPAIFTNIQNMIAPGTNVIDTEPSESVSDEELLKDVKICYTSEPVSLTEEEINGIIAAHIKQGLDEKEGYEEYVVKCYGADDGIYAVKVFDGISVEQYFKNHSSSVFKFDIYHNGQIYDRRDAAEKGLFNAELFMKYADTCLKYLNINVATDVDILTPETYLEGILEYGTFTREITFDDMIDIPDDIKLQMTYLHLLGYVGEGGYTAEHLPKCYFEKNGIYVYISSHNGAQIHLKSPVYKYDIKGCEFYQYADGEDLFVLINGNRYSLDDAYNRGLLDDAFIDELYDVYISGNWWGICPNKDLKNEYKRSIPMLKDYFS